MRILIAAVGILGIGLTAGAQAASVVTLAPNSAHPAQAVTLSASGFGASEAVDVYVDTADTLLLVTSATGTLSAPITLPTQAQPGAHYITAIGRHSGDAAQATISVTTPWAELGYGQTRLGLNPFENTLTPSNVSSLGVNWSVAGPGSGGTPAVVAGRVVAAGLNGIQEVVAANGARVWNTLTTEYFYASPAVSAGGLYIGGSSGNFYDLNFGTGAITWSRALDTTGLWFSSAVVAGSTVYVGTYNGGVVYALNKTTGATLWSYTTGGSIISSPAIANGIVYIGSEDNKLYALNATTGALIWSYTTGSIVVGSPAVANGVVYVGSYDGKVYALKASNGALLWTYATGAGIFTQPAIANGTVFIGSIDHKIYALNAHSGALQWSFLSNDTVGSAVVANGVVYVASGDDSFYAFAASYGGLLASGTLGFTQYGSPAVSDGVVYINAYAGNLTALALQGGTSAVRPAAPRIGSLHPDYRLTVANR